MTASQPQLTRGPSTLIFQHCCRSPCDGITGQGASAFAREGMGPPFSGVRAVFQEVRGGFGIRRGSREFGVGAGSGCGEDVACGTDA